MNKYILTVTLNPCIDRTIAIHGFNYGGLNCPLYIRDDVGGKGINVSKVLSDSGMEICTYALTAGGNGNKVKECVASVGGRGIFTDCEGETRVNIKLQDTKSGITTEINDRSFGISEDKAEVIEKTITELLSDCCIMVLSGSLPRGIDKGFYARLTDKAKEKGVKVILDADGDKLKEGIGAKPYAIKPNIHEFGQLNGKEYQNNDELIQDMKKYVDSGISLVAVSMGAEGAIFADKTGVASAKPFDIKCESTVGAGDSMVAAMAYCICKGESLTSIAKHCTAAGTLTSSKKGTEVCSFREISERMDEVEIFET